MYHIVAESNSGLNIAAVVALDFLSLSIVENSVLIHRKRSIAADMRRP